MEFIKYLGTDDVFYDDEKHMEVLSILNRAKEEKSVSSPSLLTDNHLTATLSRHREGQAAVVIIRVTETDDLYQSPQTDRFLLQRKSPDYPVPIFGNTLCIYGGNAEAIDNNQPFETLIRELKEEIPTEIVDILLRNGIEFLNFAYHYQEPKVLRKRTDLQGLQTNDPVEGDDVDYGYVCALYEGRISSRDLNSIFSMYENRNELEGNHVLFSREEVLQDPSGFAWGYDHTMSRYFGENVHHFKDGVTVTGLGNGGEFGDSRYVKGLVNDAIV